MDLLGVVVGVVVGLIIGAIILYFTLRWGIDKLERELDRCLD
jgi:uncharacterized membrane-anchored protein YhcB (DUF1043 family)